MLKSAKKNYFKGWYFKQMNNKASIAFIPAYHIDDKGVLTASLQVITENKAYNLSFEKEDFEFNQPLNIKIGNNIFSDKGIFLDINTEEIRVKGELTFTKMITPIKDIMGPFKYLPFMQCRHGVISLAHNVNGALLFNNEELVFSSGTGYIETDSGSSFPSSYLWTQCSFEDEGPSSLMLSIANIPFLGFNFTGCLCLILHKGKIYTLATYKGAKILNLCDGFSVIKQGKMVLSAERIADKSQILKAPRKGKMERLIKESLVCQVRYVFLHDDKIIFDFISDRACFELDSEVKD